MADTYISVTGNTTDALVVPVKAATVYAAHENSLFLSGQLIPVVNAPNGVLQVPELANVTASTIGGSLTADVAVTNPSQTKNAVYCDLYAARSVVRDLGAIDPSEIGRSLGNGVAQAFDADVADVVETLTAHTTTLTSITDQIFEMIGAIRGGKEMGQLYGLVSADKYQEVMSDIGSANYAGGLWQGAALQSGLLGNIAGVPFFVTSYLATGMAVFSADAMRIAMQKNVDVEIARRAEAVGNDVVASLHAGVGMIDAGRGRWLAG